MILRYKNTIEDILSFNRYYCDHSPTIRRSRRFGLIFIWVVLILGAIVIPELIEDKDLGQSDFIFRIFLVLAAILCAWLSSFVYKSIFLIIMDRQVKSLYSEGQNKGLLCEHELEITTEGLIERTEFNETSTAWQGIENIAETETHAFLFIAATMAHVIPKESISSGDSVRFIEQAKQLWSAAN